MDTHGYSVQMFVDEKGCFFGQCLTKGAHYTWFPVPSSIQLEENNFQGGVHIVPKSKVKEVAEKMLGKTPLGSTWQALSSAKA